MNIRDERQPSRSSRSSSRGANGFGLGGVGMMRFAVMVVLMSFLLSGCAGTKSDRGDDGVQVKARGSVETSYGVGARW